MSTTITYPGGETIRPHLALIASYARSRQTRTVVHEILDGPPVFTLRHANTSTGTLRLLFRDEQAATDCYDAHEVPAIFTINDTARKQLRFRYVPSGRVSITLDESTGDLWLVEVDYQETT